jgi:hypothetical protein
MLTISTFERSEQVTSVLTLFGDRKSKNKSWCVEIEIRNRVQRATVFASKIHPLGDFSCKE